MSRTARLLALGLSLAATMRAQAAVEVLHYELLELDAAVVSSAQKAILDTTEELRFIAFGREFALELERNARLAGLGRALSSSAALIPYRGRLEGADDSWLRLVRSGAGWSGLIWDGSELFGVETDVDNAADVAHTIVYRLADVYVSPGTLGCGSGAASMNGAVEFATLVEELTPLAAAGAEFNLNLGAVADSDFGAIHGADTETALLTRFNNVDGIFSEQLGIQISVAEIDIMEAGSDPFTETDAEALLDQLAVFRGADPDQDSQGLTHLFTGKNLNGSTVGIAFVGALCATRSAFDPQQRSFGVGLSEGRSGSVIDSLIAAHEIGHNFGAPHDAETGSACETTPALFLMAPTINGNDQFSACSIDEMQADIAAAQCLEPIARADLSLRAVDGQTEVLAGDDLEYALAVANVGGETATGPLLDISIGSGLEVSGATTDAGICAVVAAQVDCVLDDIPDGSETLVTLSLVSSNPGTFSVSGTVSSDDDANLDNNDLSETIGVLTVVDLSLAGPAAASMQVGQTSQLTYTLTNRSDSIASALVLSVALPSGLAADSASLAGTDCDVATATIICQLGQLAARASAMLVLDLRAIGPGSHDLTIEANAAEAERDLDTNTLSVVVTVSQVAPPETQGGAGTPSSGGGGAADLAWLLLLLAFGARRLTGFFYRGSSKALALDGLVAT